MRRDEARDALEQARAMDAKVRPLGRWYAVYGFGYGLASMVLLLVLGLTGSFTGMIVGMVFFGLALLVLSLYMAAQPVKPLHYGKLHTWGIAGWSLVYSVAIVAGMYLFQGEPLWWVPMAVLSAVPMSVAGYLAWRFSRSAR